MPYSSRNGKWAVRRLFDELRPARVLDVGVGCGTYARMLRLPGQHWTGVEVWVPYADKFKLGALYDRMVYADARKWEPEERYDLAIAGDVLEHMTADEAAALLHKLRRVADTVVVSIPIGHYPQDAFEGNPYERHVVDHWTDEGVRAELGEPTWSTVDEEIGIYVYSERKVMALRIAVYAISKNEEQFVRRFVESARDADHIVIVDTGSTDNTVRVAQSLPEFLEDAKLNVHTIRIKPWRFDLARNAALALVPECDVCVSLDLDEVLTPGWRQEIERHWKLGQTTRLRYGFDWGHGIVFQYEKIHARDGYRWHHPCHEYPVPDGRIKEQYAQTPKVLVVHKPDPTKSRGQYMDLLELSVKEDPSCPRNAFYYARELTFHHRWADAVKALERYLSMPNADWHNERCYAMRLMGDAYEKLGQGHTAMQWYRRACAEAPYTREPWVDLAGACYRRNEWPECYAAAKNALAIKDKALVYTCDPTAWGSKPHDFLALAAFHLGLYAEAYEHGKTARDLDPGDARLQTNLAFYEAEHLKRNPPQKPAEVDGGKLEAVDAPVEKVKPKTKAKPKAKKGKKNVGG